MASVSGSRFRWLASAAALVTFGLVVLGGVVRTSGAGLACPDWPLCQGKIIPPLDGPTLIEYSHRLVAVLTSIFVSATAWLAWRRYRAQKWILRPALLALGLLALQVILGGLTVVWKLPPTIVAVHLSNALIILAMLLIVATFAFRPGSDSPNARARDTSSDKRYPRLVLASTIGTFLLIVSGAVATGTFAGYTCPTWPLCNEQIIPQDTLPQIAMLHRFIAAAIGLLILYTFVETWKTRRNVSLLIRAGAIAATLFLAQVVISAANVLLHFPLWLTLLHLGAAAAVWSSMVVFTILAYQAAGIEHEKTRSDSTPAPKPRTAIADYFALTKPWIVALLLVTTLSGMLVAQRGIPSLSLVFFTLLGGACAAGGASALNSYFDRDMDKLMGRTSQRPLPTGRVTPRAALIFGVVLCAVSLIIFFFFVNALSAFLAFAGMVYYAGIYTLWLKRRTPQNVVIGGAAGAIPPLVGWAAVTNDLSLLAIYLFLIVFYWTPPHTWALMLMVKKDYERVQVPMMPVARGETETRNQILLYSLLLFVITLIPVSVGDLSWFYFLAALALGGYFLFLSLVVRRDTAKRAARRLYYFSNAYLALLFLTMVIDRSMFGMG